MGSSSSSIFQEFLYKNKTESVSYVIFFLIVMMFFIFVTPQYAYSVSFSTPPVSVNGTGNGPLTDEQLAVSGNNVYVVWTNKTQTGSGPHGVIFFSNSSNNGASFFKPLHLSRSGDSGVAQIAVTGSHDYVVWMESGHNDGNYDLMFANSTNNGNTFQPLVNFTRSLTNIADPKMITDGTKVYLTWANNTRGDIYFVNGTDGGTSSGVKFDYPIKALTNNGLAFSVSNPEITTSGNHIYIVWESFDQTTSVTNVFFTNSTDGGRTFSTPTNLSNVDVPSVSTANKPQIAVSGTHVYVVWESDTPHGTGIWDVYLDEATDSGSGAKFTTLKNLSNDGGTSANPQIATNGNKVYVVWDDDTINPFVNKEINFTMSTNSGTTFSPGVNLSTNSGNSQTPRIAVDSSNVYVVWQDNTASSPNLDVFFRASTDGGSTFGALQNLSTGKASDPLALVTPVLAASSGNAYVAWAHGVPGIFPIPGTGDIFFRLGAASASLTTINFDLTQYRLADTATITVFAPDYNSTSLTTPDTIDVNITSTSDPVGFGITLTETSVKSATFTGTIHFSTTATNSGTSTIKVATGDTITASFAGDTATAFIYHRTVSFDSSGYPLDKNATITITDQNSNNPAVVDTINGVTVTSTSDPIGVTFSITEASADAGGIFSKKIGFEPYTAASHLILQAKVGDTITATFLGKSGTATILPGTGPGGGGGGAVVSPGLVLDAAGGGSYAPSALVNMINNLIPNQTIMPGNDPSIDYPISINGKGFPISTTSNKIMTSTISTGQSVPVDFVFYTQYPIVHASLYLNIRGLWPSIPSSDTYVLYDVGQKPKIVDPQGFLSTVDISSSQKGLENKFDYKMTFAKQMPKSDIIVRIWDTQGHSSDELITDAFQVMQSVQNNQNTQPTSPQILASSVPQSINVQTQSTRQTDLMSAIKEWGGYSPQSISDSQLLNALGIEGQHIPSWVMKETKWVADNNLSQDEFVNVIKYLSEKGIVK